MEKEIKKNLDKPGHQVESEKERQTDRQIDGQTNKTIYKNT